MKRLVLTSLLFLVPACGTSTVSNSPFLEPNQLMGQEIEQRVAQIPYQHREILYNNLLWLAKSGEQAIPELLRGLQDKDAKVRSSCIWILGRIADLRTVDNIKPLILDENQRVRLEAARTLLVLGDVSTAPIMIEGLDSDKVQVRYLCHEALKITTRRDFGFDHLSEDLVSRQAAIYGWRTWWADQSGDQFFASTYAEEHNIDTGEPGWEPQTDAHAAPGGETAPGKGDTGVPNTEPDNSTTEPDTTITEPDTTITEPDTTKIETHTDPTVKVEKPKRG